MRLINILTIATIFSIEIFSQEITFIPRSTTVVDTAGDEVVAYIDLQNVSQSEQTVFVIRTLNQLPNGWTTSLCFEYCYPDWVDSIATTATFGSSPLQPGEVREVSVHFFTNNIPNTGMVQLQAGTFRTPDQRITVDIQATTFDPTSVADNSDLLNEFKLEQNYPNPFNPTTKIGFVIPNGVRNLVTLKVYDILGNEIASLVNEEKTSGYHEITFNAGQLNIPSGVYFYRLTAGAFTQTKAMILEK